MSIDELNKACPDHDRSSCSDASPINAGIDYRYGTTWCRRCEGLHNIRTDARITELETALTIRDTEIARLREALGEVMEWIDNWDPNFTMDGEWPASREKARAAIDAARGAG